jgi:RNA polymerase sigma-70 factor (ECF subfamily)
VTPEARAVLEAALRADCDRGAHDAATEAAIRGYGREILQYLVGIARNDTDAADAFALFCEDLWRALPSFRWESSLRAWAYAVAQHALHHVYRDPHRRRAYPLSRASELADEVRSSTLEYLRTGPKNRFAEIRADLDAEDQALLELRIERKLSWPEIARILLAGEGDATSAAILSGEPDAATVERKVVALRKRFERLKDALRARRADIFGD